VGLFLTLPRQDGPSNALLGGMERAGGKVAHFIGCPF